MIHSSIRWTVVSEVTLDGMKLLPVMERRMAPMARTLFWRGAVGSGTMRAVRGM